MTTLGQDHKLNILVFRSVRTEDMGYVINDICKKFKNINSITVIAREENKFSLQKIPNVSEVLTYNHETFDINKKFTYQIMNLKKYKFDSSIIPTNGNIVNYDNIIKFNKKIFGNNKIYYYKYPENFIYYKTNISKEIFKKLLFIPIIAFSSLLSILYITFVYLKYFYTFKIKNKK